MCGDELATQDFNYTSSEQDKLYYGSYFDDHNVLVQVFPMAQDDVSIVLCERHHEGRRTESAGSSGAVRNPDN